MVLTEPRPNRAAAEPFPARHAGRVPLLFLLADTGGGHRSAARAVSEALEEAYPGRFDPVLCDPLAGQGSAWLLRWVTKRYGPVTRLAPWAWGAAYHACDSRWVMRLLGRTLLALADRPVAAAVAAHEPAARGRRRGDRVAGQPDRTGGGPGPVTPAPLSPIRGCHLRGISQGFTSCARPAFPLTRGPG